MTEHRPEPDRPGPHRASTPRWRCLREAWSRHAVVAVVAVVLAGCAAAFIGEQYLSWDASLHLFRMLQHDELHVIKDRWSMALMQLPLHAAYEVTDELPVLIDAYGLIYSFVPALCVAALAGLLRRRTELFVLGVVGVCATVLIFQYAWHSEHLIACQVQWVLLALVVRARPTAGWTVPVAAVAALIFGLHPVSIPLLVVGAVCAVLCGDRSRYRWALAAGLLALAMVRALMLAGSPGDLELVRLDRIASELGWLARPPEHWQLRRDPPAVLYLLLWLTAAALSVVPPLWGRRRRWLRWVLLGAATASLFAWLHGNAQNLDLALELRHLIVVVSAVPYAAFIWLARRGRGGQEPAAARGPTGWLSPGYALAIAIVSAVYLADVSAVRQRHLAMADAWLSRSEQPCRPIRQYVRDHLTFLEHWALTYEHILYTRSRKPAALFAHECDFDDSTQPVRLAKHGAPVARRGYFDLTGVIATSDGEDAAPPSPDR